MSEIRARIVDVPGHHEVELETNGRTHPLEVASGPGGVGSALNGGELLCLALATCYCNDLHREARKRGVTVTRVEVEVRASFPREGAAARDLAYDVRVEADGDEDAVVALMRHTDTVAEIQNTVRQAVPVPLARARAVATKAAP